MGDYLPILPRASESFESESLASLFARAARQHAVTLIQFLRHLRHWWERQHQSPSGLAEGNIYGGASLCGIGTNIDSYITVLSEAMGVPNLDRLTLRSLRPATAKLGQHTLKYSRAWCPACMHERLTNDGEHFDSLLWRISVIERCPVHRLRLVELCPACGQKQTWPHRNGALDLCWRCESSLIPDWRRWTLQLEPGFGERDCIALVESIACGTLSEAAPDALQTFCLELRAVMSTVYKSVTAYSPKIDRVRVLGRTARPTLYTMLRQAEASGVPLVHILREPREAALIAGELDCVRRKLPEQLRPRPPKEASKLVLDRMSENLALPASTISASLRTLAKSVGVSTGFLRNRLPEETAAYVKDWRKRRDRRRSHHVERINNLLRAELITRYRRGEIRSHDEIVEILVARLDVGKSLARAVLATILREANGSAAGRLD